MNECKISREAKNSLKQLCTKYINRQALEMSLDPEVLFAILTEMETIETHNKSLIMELEIIRKRLGK